MLRDENKVLACEIFGVFFCIFGKAYVIMKLYMNPSYTNEVGASAGNFAGAPMGSGAQGAPMGSGMQGAPMGAGMQGAPVGTGAFGPSSSQAGGDIILGAPKKKSRKWVVIGIVVALGLIGGGIALWQSGVFENGSSEEEYESEDMRSMEAVEIHDFVEVNNEEVLQFLSTIEAIYEGEVPAEMFKVSEDDAVAAKEKMKSGLEQLKTVSEEVSEGQALDDEELDKIYAGLKTALNRDLPKFEQFVEFLNEIFDGFQRGEDIAGIDGGDGQMVAAAFQEKIPDLQVEGEGSVVGYWTQLWDATRMKESVPEDQDEE